MNKISIIALLLVLFTAGGVSAQPAAADGGKSADKSAAKVADNSAAKVTDNSGYQFTTVMELPVTPTRNQNRSSTCWSFSTLAFLESEAIKKGAPADIYFAPMFPVFTNYMEKAERFVRMDGALNFAGGGSTDDVLCTLAGYGLVPESAMPGLNYGESNHVHGELDAVTKAFVEAVAKNPNKKLSTAWKSAFKGILEAYLGKVPEKFEVNGKEYTPKEYAASLGLKAEDYIGITSYTHHPFYTTFVLEVPDNWRSYQLYNVPMEELVEIIDYALEKGYTVAWAADVSEKGFTRDGLAIVPDVEANEKSEGSDQARWVGVDPKEKEQILHNLKSPGKEKVITQEMRQVAYDNKETTDDHGMQIFGIAKDQNGTKYYIVKNSWGERGKYKGRWYASLPYVQYKTMDILVNKAAVPAHILKKLGVK